MEGLGRVLVPSAAVPGWEVVPRGGGKPVSPCSALRALGELRVSQLQGARG